MIKMVIKLAFLDNDINEHVFEDDAQIVSFLKNEAQLSNRNQSRLHDQYGDQIINLNSKKLPKSLITLESVFNPNDKVIERGINFAANKVDHVPIIVVDGRMLTLGKACS